MAQDRLKEEIKFLTEICRFLSVLWLGLSGGTFSFIFGELTRARITFALAGFVGIIVPGVGLYRLQRHVRHLIAQIKED